MIRACKILTLSEYRDYYSDYDGDIDDEHPIRSLADRYFNTGMLSLIGLSRLNQVLKKYNFQFHRVSSRHSDMQSYAILSKCKNSKPSKCLSDFGPVHYVNYEKLYKSNGYGSRRW